MTDFRLNRSNINTNGNSTSDEGIQFGEFSGNTVGAIGVVSILNSSVNANAHNGFHLRNTSGTISSFTVTGSTFNDVNDVTGANAFLFEASGTSVVTAATISGTTFSNNSPQRALEVQVHDTGSISDFVVQNNAFSGNGIHASFTQDTAGNLEFRFLNNGTSGSPMVGSILQAVNVFSSSQSTGGTIVGTISGNFVGATQANFISAVIQGQTDATLLIDSNFVRQTNGDSRAITVAFRGPANPLAGTLGPTTVVSDVTSRTTMWCRVRHQAESPPERSSLKPTTRQALTTSHPRSRADIRNNIVPTTPVSG